MVHRQQLPGASNQAVRPTLLCSIECGVSNVIGCIESLESGSRLVGPGAARGFREEIQYFHSPGFSSVKYLFIINSS